MTLHNNTIVLDIETLVSAEDCLHCGASKEEHGPYAICPRQEGDVPPENRQGASWREYEPLGWHHHAILGLSIGCYYDYLVDRYFYFDQGNLEETLRFWVARSPLIVSYNGRQFDCPLLEAVLLNESEDRRALTDLAAAFRSLFLEQSYDLLDQIWKCDAINRFAKGNGLGAVASANGYGSKALSGASAPHLWDEGEYARVINYCTDDVWKTRKLFEQVCAGKPLQRTAGPITLPLPTWCALPADRKA